MSGAGARLLLLVMAGGEGDGGDGCGERDADRPPECVLEGAGGAVGELGLEGDGDDRDAERGADLLGDAGVHGGVWDACRGDVLIGDRHRRDQHGPDPEAADEEQRAEPPLVGVRVGERERDRRGGGEQEACDRHGPCAEAVDELTDDQAGGQGADALGDQDQSRVQHGLAA